MRRLALLLTGFIIAQLCLPYSSSAAVKPGSKCNKLGQKIMSGNSRYTCIKSGKRLVWGKTSTVSKANTSQITPTPIPTLNPVDRERTRVLEILLSPQSPKIGEFCASSGSEEYSSAGPIRCSSGKWTLVPMDQDSVATRAFRFIWQRWQEVKDDKVESQIIVDPSIKFWGEWAVTAYEGGAKYWRATAERMVVHAIVSDNGPWLESKARDLGWPWGETLANALLVRPWDNQAVNKGTPDAAMDYLPWAHILVEGDPHPGLNTGISHEFGHVAQISLSKGQFFRTGGRRVPWLDEGMPSLIGAALSPLVGMRYNTRPDWVQRAVRYDVQLKDISVMNEVQANSGLWTQVYAAGYFASEALIAVYGDRCIDDIYRAMSDRMGMDHAFKKVIGIDVRTTATAIEPYHQSVRVGRPLSLGQVEDLLKNAGAVSPPQGWTRG